MLNTCSLYMKLTNVLQLISYNFSVNVANFVVKFKSS